MGRRKGFGRGEVMGDCGDLVSICGRVVGVEESEWEWGGGCFWLGEGNFGVGFECNVVF